MTNLACIIYVKNVLKKLGLRYISVELGQIEIIDDIDYRKLLKLNILLKEADLELMKKQRYHFS
jgi:hypothetical protein